MDAPKYVYSDRRLQRKIQGLRKIYKECEQEKRPGKRRFPHRSYVAAVYALFVGFGAGIRGTQVARRIAELYEVPIRKNAGLIRSIIDATAGRNLDIKTASRWSQAVKFAWSERRHWSDFEVFISRHGGIHGCAEAHAEMNKEERSIKNQANWTLMALKKKAARKQAEKWPQISRTIVSRSPSAEPKLPLGPPRRISVTHLNPIRHQRNGPFRRRKVKTCLLRAVRWRRHP